MVADVGVEIWTETPTTFRVGRNSLSRECQLLLFTTLKLTLTADFAFAASCEMRVAYCTVDVWSSVDRMAIPSLLITTTPITPLCVWIRFSVSSTSD